MNLAGAELLDENREHDKAPPPLPDWRITRCYADPKHRGHGVSRAVLASALDQISHARGGRVEAISEVTADRQTPVHFLFSATVELIEQFGFTRERQVGKHARIVRRVVDSQPNG